MRDKSVMERKLTAILSADVEGYSRLMGENEEATVRTLTEYREVMGGLIERHRGHVIDSPGDNLLAQFASAVDAVECAVAIQKDLRRRNADYVEDRRMHFRIGINLGDVIVECERIYGDGVNVAARVESLAEGGGISVSGTAYDQVVNKLSFAFDNQGEHTVKNIAEPVRVYAVRWDVEKIPAGKDKLSKRGVWVTALVLVVAAIAFIVWRQFFQESISLPPTEIPSIAVLPFRDMSPEKDQEYFCEGIAEEILNALAQIEGLRVASRTSSFRFRDAAITTIGEQLNVKTVLEGSVRKDGNSIRITAQLNNAVDDFHLWSKNYDRELKNIFAIQDEIAQSITQVLQVKLMGESGAHLVKHYTDNIEAYDQYLLGRYLWGKRGGQRKQSEIDLMAAINHFEKAIAFDPNYALAYSGLADVYNYFPTYVPGIKVDDVKAQAEDAAKKALALDPNLAEAHASFGRYKDRFLNDYKGAEREYKRAIELNPKYAPVHFFYGNLLKGTGRNDEALSEYRRAYELEPYSGHYTTSLGYMFIEARQYAAAISHIQSAIELYSSNRSAWSMLGAAYIYVKKYEDAKRAFSRWAELAGENKELLQHFVSLVEEYDRTGEPVSPQPELETLFAKVFWELPGLYAFLGQKEKTLEALEGKRSYSLTWPQYDFLRAEPRFIALERKREQLIEKRMMGVEKEE